MDTEALQQALAAVAQRHELLRSRFWHKDGKLVQSIDQDAPKLEFKSLRGSDGAVQGLIQVMNGSPCEQMIPCCSEASPEEQLCKASTIVKLIGIGFADC